MIYAIIEFLMTAREIFEGTTKFPMIVSTSMLLNYASVNNLSLYNQQAHK